MRLRFVTILAALACLAACGPSPTGGQHGRASLLPAEKVPLGPLPRTVVPIRYRIALAIDPAKDIFSGHVEIDVNFTEKRRTIFLHGRGLNVLGASVRLSAQHSVPAHYMQVDKSGVARLLFVDAIPAGKATLVFDYEAPFGRQLDGLYKVVDRGNAYAFTQFEAIAARDAFPSFDEPGFKTPFQISVTAPGADKVISNTPVQSATREDGRQTLTLFQWTKPLPTYLVAFAVGPFDIVDAGDVPANAYRRRPVHIRGIAARGEGARMQYALSLTPKIVAALEDYFGMAYPFQKLDILAVPDFAAGAMENAGAITFRERLLLLDPDASLDQKRSSLNVQAHEITHQWFGDLVTPAWWDDAWLNESFATWMEYKVAATIMPEGDFDSETLRNTLDVMELDELPSAREVHQPVRKSYEIENAFDDITYDKGAAVLSMYEDYLGPDAFRRGIHDYLAKFAYGNATAHDFIATVAGTVASLAHEQREDVTIRIDRTGAIFWNNHRVPNEAAVIDQMSHMAASISAPQIVHSFDSFIDQPGVPALDIRTKCDAASAFANVTQRLYTPIGGTAAPRKWDVPVCMSGAGDEKICRLIDRRSADVLLGSSCPQALMPNAGGKGYYRFSFDEPGWQPLIKSAPKLAPAEQITLLRNLDAALRSGHARAADVFATVGLLAPVARWDVLDTIGTVLQRLRTTALSQQDLPAYRTFVQKGFAPRLAALGLTARKNEKPSDTLAREQLVTLLVGEARDPQVIAALAKSASDYLGGARTMPPEILGDAMRAGLIAGGAPFADQLVKAMASTDQEFFRRQMIYAFAGSDDPAAIGKLLAFALTPRMRTGELRYLYEYLSKEPVARAALWSWYKRNFDVILARVSAEGMIRAVGQVGSACDAATRADAEAFFRPKVDMLAGTRRPLAEAEEKIDRCIAFRQAKAGEISTALHAPTQPVRR